MRGQNGFPRGQKGFVFAHRELREVWCQYTGIPIPRYALYYIRIDPNGAWRIDEAFKIGPNTAVYGPNREGYFQTPSGAAEALQYHLDLIAETSSL